MRKATEAQIGRIARNEEMMEHCLRELPRLEEALERYRSVRGELERLRKYYTGRYWLKDFEADEAGLLPADMKRGVLSEDGIDRLLDSYGELEEELGKILGWKR